MFWFSFPCPSQSIGFLNWGVATNPRLTVIDSTRRRRVIHGSANTRLFTFLVLLRPWFIVWKKIDFFKERKSSIYTQAKVLRRMEWIEANCFSIVFGQRIPCEEWFLQAGRPKETTARRVGSVGQPSFPLSSSW